MDESNVQRLVREYNERHDVTSDVIPTEVALQAEVIHASQSWNSGTLCGESPVDVLLALDHPLARIHRHTVNCPDCLEWMHA